MNLLTDPVLSINRGNQVVSLSGLFAAMSRGDVTDFPALRPHQRAAWHMFLVQLATVALQRSNSNDLSGDPSDWEGRLRRLTHGHADDSPWTLVVDDRNKPAFMQPPWPGDVRNEKHVSTPDELDILITSKNHDLKSCIGKHSGAEDWVFALVSLQTSAGYDGSGNHGIARMNGGYSSRSMLGLAPAQGKDFSISPSAWWSRDVRQLARKLQKSPGVGVVSGAVLLWCEPWREDKGLNLEELDPMFIEVSRRVRLLNTNGCLAAVRATSKKPRIDAKEFNGNTGDPWAPINKEKGEAFTLGRTDFDYKKLHDLLFSGKWAVPLLARPGEGENGDMVLIAEALSRHQGKTEGLKTRVVLIPNRSVYALLSNDRLQDLSGAQIDEIKKFEDALGNALALVAAGGETSKEKKNKHYSFAKLAKRRFNRYADRIFFPALWRRSDVSVDGEAEKLVFLSKLKKQAEVELEVALPTIPCKVVFSPRAAVRARASFRRQIHNEFPELLVQGRENVPD